MHNYTLERRPEHLRGIFQGLFLLALPELLKAERRAGPSCAQAVEEEVQGLFVNRFMAAIVGQFLFWLLRGQLSPRPGFSSRSWRWFRSPSTGSTSIATARRGPPASSRLRIC